MSGGGKTQTTTTDTSPWKEQQPYLKDVFAQAQANSQTPKTMYAGDMIANKTANDAAAEQGLAQYAGTLANQTGNNLNALNWALGDGNLDVGNNQYVQGQMAANTNRLYQDFNDKTVPALRSNFTQAGQIGGSRQGIAEGLAAQGVARSAADSNAQIQGTAYQNALNTYSSALAQAPNLMQAGLLSPNALAAAGASQRGFTQADIEEQIARHNFQQQEADARLAQYASLVGGNFGGTTTSTAPKQGGGMFGGIAGGMLAALPLGLMTGGIGIPAALALGAGTGALGASGR